MSARKTRSETLRQRIERLEAEVEALREVCRRSYAACADMLAESVDMRTRVEQAISILHGASK